VKATQGFPVRLRFTERGKVRFVSHRDVARAFERAFRIEGLPLAFTLGFAPRPKVSFGLALSVGHESDAEYLDVEFREPVDVHALTAPLSEALPEGIDVTGATRLVDRALALQESVSLVEYRVTVTNQRGEVVGEGALTSAIDAAMARDTLPVARIRKGRESVDDIRPALRGVAVAVHDGYPALEFELATQGRGFRPCEVLDALARDFTEHRTIRTAQWIERDGARLEPLEADAFARTMEARAS
jgi:radical SAM-linked protein